MPKAVYVPKSMIDAVLTTPPVQGKRQIPSFAEFCKTSGFPAPILEDHKLTVGMPEWHRHEEDFWYCLEGQAVFTVGGRGVDPFQKEGAHEHEWKAKAIEGGDVHLLTPGDSLWIPAGVWHMHTSEGTARLFIMKRAAPELAPKPI